ncbi:MAG: VTT domain-containing protein [Solirubrobacteraceae bacterium]|nr:VTT domain-containing protein [Patulibacter sp.]
MAIVLTVALVAVAPVRDVLSAVVHGDLDAMRERLDALGPWAALVLLALGLLHVLVPFPAELPNAAAGFALGFWAGVPVMLGVWVISGLAAYWLARTAGRPALTRLLGERRIEEAERFVDSGGTTALLAARLIPVVPFSFASFAAGLALVPVRRFAWTTAVGFFPLTATTVLIGSRLRSPNYADPLLWGPIVAALAIVLGLGIAQRRRSHRAAAAAAEPAEPPTVANGS